MSKHIFVLISIYLEGGGDFLQICVLTIVTREMSYSNSWGVPFGFTIFYNLQLL